MLIIVNVKNFTLAHEIYVLDDQKGAVTSRKSSVKNLEENILEVCKEYNCWKVSLLGNKKYAQKISENLKSKGLAKYQQNIEII